WTSPAGRRRNKIWRFSKSDTMLKLPIRRGRMGASLHGLAGRPGRPDPESRAPAGRPRTRVGNGRGMAARRLRVPTRPAGPTAAGPATVGPTATGPAAAGPTATGPVDLWARGGV